MSESRVKAPIGNYYGRPYVRWDGREGYFIGLDDFNSGQELPVSRAFYEAWVEEFGRVT
jgi:hypothetical protein